MSNFFEKCVVIASKTVQITENSWERQNCLLEVNKQTTVDEIIQWVNRMQADKYSIKLYPVDEIM